MHGYIPRGYLHDIPWCSLLPPPHVVAGLVAGAAWQTARATGLAALATLVRSRRACRLFLSRLPPALPPLPPPRLAAGLSAGGAGLVVRAAGPAGLAALTCSRRVCCPQHQQCCRRRRRARPSPWSPPPRSPKLHLTLRFPTLRWRAPTQALPLGLNLCASTKTQGGPVPRIRTPAQGTV